jgi:hypothetical protein
MNIPWELTMGIPNAPRRMAPRKSIERRGRKE